MAEHHVPRWMNVLWVVLVLCMISSFVVVGLRRGYDFVQIIGFLGVYRLWIFSLALLLGLVPYTVNLFLGLHRRKSPMK